MIDNIKINLRVVISLCFFSGGLGIGTWGANLPALGRQTGSSDGQIGIVLLCFAVGAIVAMFYAPRIIRRLSGVRSCVVAASLFGAGIMTIGLVAHLWQAMTIAALCGLFFGTLDVAMNREAAAVELAARKPMMSSFHAIFSLGTLLSSIAYAWFVHAGPKGPTVVAVAGGTVVAIAILAGSGARSLDRKSPDANDSKGSLAAPGWTHVLPLGAMAFIAFLAEGAVLDWAALYLVRSVGSSESIGALGYAIFAGTMTFGRLLGDRANLTFGQAALFRASTATVAVGMAVALAADSAPLVLVALGACGLGVANVVPVIFSSAGRLSQADGGRAMSRVLTMGYAGFLLGPAFIGFVAQLISLRVSLGSVIVSMVVLVFCSRFLHVRPRSRT